MRSPACLIFAIIGLFTVASVCDAAHVGSAPRPVARVPRVASAPRPTPAVHSVAPTQSAIRSSFRALRSEVRHDLQRNRGRNQTAIIVASGYPYGYYGNDPSNALPYTPNEYTAPGSDESQCQTSPGGSTTVAPGNVNPENGELRDDLYQEQARLKSELEASPGWAAVNADISTSRTAIGAARQHVDESLAASSEYQVAKTQKAAAEELLASLRSADHPDETKISAAAENKLQASQAMTRLEQQALATDSNYADANSKLQFAAAVRNGLLESLRAQLRNEGR